MLYRRLEAQLLSPLVSELGPFPVLLKMVIADEVVRAGAGVISDITTPAERGGLIGTFGGSMRSLVHLYRKSIS